MGEDKTNIQLYLDFGEDITDIQLDWDLGEENTDIQHYCDLGEDNTDIQLYWDLGEDNTDIQFYWDLGVDNNDIQLYWDLGVNNTDIQFYWELGEDNNDIQLYWGERGKHDVQLYSDLFKKYINFFWCTTEHGHHKVMHKYKKRTNKKVAVISVSDLKCKRRQVTFVVRRNEAQDIVVTQHGGLVDLNLTEPRALVPAQHDGN